MVALALVLALQDPLAHWPFDGDFKDAAGKASGKGAGRVEFIDSPVGGGAGKLLVLNGVDASAETGPVETKGDFTLSLWAMPLELRPSTIAGSLSLLADGALRWGERLQTPAGLAFPGNWMHVAVAVEKGAGRLYVNGVAAASGAAAPPDPAAPLVFGKGGAKLFAGLLDDARIYSTALGEAAVREIVARGLPWLRPKPHARKPFGGAFALEEHDVVVFVGGENTLGAQEEGHLETLLALQAGPKEVFFRGMAWEGETVHEQWRILNFGDWKRQFERTGASVVLVQLGQMEALEGKAGLERFAAAYEGLLDEFAKATSRIVIVSPLPFEKPEPPLPDHTAKNEDLGFYVEATRALAKKRGLLFVDLFSEPRPTGERLTRDGIHLTPGGQAAVAQAIARRLAGGDVEPGGPAYERVREAVRKKNRLWSEYWRPMNWAFLNGDRIEQPSSRDHLDRRIRWFPVEVQQYPALIRREEANIRRLLVPR